MKIKAKIIIISVALIVLNTLIVDISYSQKVFEPSDLLNSVRRSETISNLFYSHWSKFLKEREVFDVYFRGSTIFGFPVTTENYGVQKLDLFRIFGGFFVRGDVYDFGTTNDPVIWHIAAGVAGYRYGLKKDVTLNNPDSGNLPSGANVSSSFTVSDYMYEQFYDDMFVMTNTIGEYLYLHLGVIVNESFKPKNGVVYSTPFVSNDTKLRSEWRFYTNTVIYGTITGEYRFNNTDEKSEYASVGFKTNKIKEIFVTNNTLKKVLPNFSMSWKYQNYYYNTQDTNRANPGKGVETIYLDVEQDFGILREDITKSLKKKIEDFFLIGIALDIYKDAAYIKDYNGGKIFREVKFAPSYKYKLAGFTNDKGEDAFIQFKVGGSYYTDPALKIYKDDESIYTLGFTGEILVNIAYIEAAIGYQWNDSSELRKLIEAADKHVFSLSFRAGL